MDKDQTPETRKANLHFRKTERANESATAWAEHLARDAATLTKTAGLKAQRLARDANRSEIPPPAKDNGGREAASKDKIK
jgi:hypothetical protein